MNIIQFKRHDKIDPENNDNWQHSHLVLSWIFSSIHNHCNQSTEIIGQGCPFVVDERIKPYLIELYRSYMTGVADSFSNMLSNNMCLDDKTLNLFINTEDAEVVFPYYDSTNKLITLKFKRVPTRLRLEFCSMFVSLNSVWTEVIDSVYPIIYKGHSKFLGPDFHSPEFAQDFIKHFNLKG